jgi:hypothetical protein
MALLFFTTAGHCQRPDQDESDVDGASSSHGLPRCQWNNTRTALKMTDTNLPSMNTMSIIRLSHTAKKYIHRMSLRNLLVSGGTILFITHPRSP